MSNDRTVFLVACHDGVTKEHIYWLEDSARNAARLVYENLDPMSLHNKWNELGSPQIVAALKEAETTGAAQIQFGKDAWEIVPLRMPHLEND